MDTSYWYNRALTNSDVSAPPLLLQMEDIYPHYPTSLATDPLRGQLPGLMPNLLQFIPPAKLIGVPIHFTEGRFAGTTMRAELHEIQKPEYGRRFGGIDRRVLDDPPVVLLQLFYTHDAGMYGEWEEEEQNYNDIALEGLICMADLFEVEGNTLPSNSANNSPSSDFFPPGTSALVDESTIAKGSNRTLSLFGTKFIEPQSISYAGNAKKWLMFTFSDLAVQLSGRFILRYRLFDLFSHPMGSTSSTILAECYGGSFEVYPTKTAPSLDKSTPLTQRLAQHGVRVNVRKDKRVRRSQVSKE
ncbi:velvet factor-domain-containing protein [Mycena crocata]|nr:velvet factor-domain-containing protein [Mycena crocata]